MNNYLGISIFTYFYDNKKLTRFFSINEQGVQNHEEIYHYGVYDDLIKMLQNVDIKVVFDYEYIYDSNNNWIQRKQFVICKLLKMTYRQIEYQ